MLNNATIEDLALIGLVAIAIWNARRAFEAWTTRNRSEGDEITEAIADQTRDLLDALTEANATLDAIRNSTDYLEESERDFNAEEDAQRSDEPIGTSLHEFSVDAWHKFRAPAAGTYAVSAPVDLSKHD